MIPVGEASFQPNGEASFRPSGEAFSRPNVAAAILNRGVLKIKTAMVAAVLAAVVQMEPGIFPFFNFTVPSLGWARQDGQWKKWPPPEAKVTAVKQGHCFLDKGWRYRFVEGVELGLYRGDWLINVGRVVWSGEGRCRVAFSEDLITPVPGDMAALPPVHLDRARPFGHYLDQGLASLRRGAYNNALASLFHAHTLNRLCRGAHLALGAIFRKYGEWDLAILWSARAAGLSEKTARKLMDRQITGVDKILAPGHGLRGHAMIAGKPWPDLSIPKYGRMNPGSGDGPEGLDRQGSPERAGGLVNIGYCLIEKDNPAGALYTFLHACEEYPKDMWTRAMAWLGSGIAARILVDRGELWPLHHADAGLAGFRRAWKGELKGLENEIPPGTRARGVLESGFFRSN